MPPIVLTISVEGEPEESIAALWRLIGAGDPPVPSAASAAAPSPDANGVDAGEPDGSGAALPASSALARYGNFRQDIADGFTTAGPESEAGVAAEVDAAPAPPPEPPLPAEWDEPLCRELIGYLTDGAKRLIDTLAASASAGMTRDALTVELGIEIDTLRTNQVSIGHSLRRVRNANGNISLPRPVEFHKQIDTYQLHPGFRAALPAPPAPSEPAPPTPGEPTPPPVHGEPVEPPAGESYIDGQDGPDFARLP